MDRHLLYAQAWAIVHHALHGESKRRDQLIAFVTRLADGRSTKKSFRTAYGIEVRDLERGCSLTSSSSLTATPVMSFAKTS